jgi:antitoxin PrlF
MIQVSSKISSKGQIVVPIEIRKHFDVKEGDSLTFIVKDNGDISLEIVKRNSILDLFGSVQAQGDTKDFEKVRMDTREEQVEQIREKMDK